MELHPMKMCDDCQRCLVRCQTNEAEILKCNTHIVMAGELQLALGLDRRRFLKPFRAIAQSQYCIVGP